MSGIVTSDRGAAISSRGVCWNTVPNPTVSDHSIPDGSDLGSFTISITGLEPKTTYYVRAYAINSEGISYGSEVDFLTDSPVPPTLTTVFIYMSESLVVVGGNVADIGYGLGVIIERGVCWSTSPLPTIEYESLPD